MRVLFPFLALFKYAPGRLLGGLILMMVGLAASIGLLTLSGWFLAATAIAGTTLFFNFFYPSAGVRGLAIGRTVTRYFEKVVTHDATFQILAKLRVMIFQKLIPLSPAVLQRYRNSELLNRLVADVDTLDSLYLRLIAPFISALAVIAFLILGLSFIDLTIAYIIGGSLTLLLIIIPILFFQLGNKFGEALTQSRSQYRTQFIEYIQAQAELMLFNADQRIKQRLDKTEQAWQQYQAKEASLNGLSSAILLFANGCIVLLTIWLAAGADLGKGDFHLALIALFGFSALASFEIFMPIGAAFLHLGQVIAAAKRVDDIINQCPLVEFKQEQHLNLAIDKTQPLICFENVSFCYPSYFSNKNQQEEYSLKSINLAIYPNQKIAILGKTGSGKSSLLKLLVRDYNPTQGQILCAGQPIENYREASLRQHICLLTQKIHIFSDSLKNNLLLANDQATDQQLIQVLEQVGLRYLIEQDERLELWLGDGGRRLSGGEQRRLGIAQILLSQAPILLLDEPTEGLDRETERQILTLLQQHCKDKTIIMVTHRLTALEYFDQICVMDNAELIEQGSYQQLLQQKGLFFNLLNRIK
ncbi:cysteine/glutathione ABC transporter ATP-binding protein/permease CydC [Mergibacter septicus]|uniref:heme ABC transporter ATP-binding protein/permease CydC n=1 Tax=Mergibacter septicus TaxID=221402 RepID=UPI001178F9DC|nr:cysteine/glutathione ABC transporter ATP-binding protein/permease CydC [Mergibacter septicus]AWX13209.1 cysteine/glutathione ABC transporter ATP-binding protein/permease CydC [Mergibacter septicus]